MKRPHQSSELSTVLMRRCIIILLTRFYSDREIIQDCLDLRSRLNELSKMNHIIIQFNENIYLHGEFMRQINKLKSKTEDVERTSTDTPRDAELLEARYDS